MLRLCRGHSLLALEADYPGHFVKVKALVALDYPPVIVMLPWSKHEQATLSAGIKSLPSWFGQGGEAVFLKHDNWISMFECCLHHSLFSRTDAWGDKDCPVLGM